MNGVKGTNKIPILITSITNIICMSVFNYMNVVCMDNCSKQIEAYQQ